MVASRFRLMVFFYLNTFFGPSRCFYLFLLFKFIRVYAMSCTHFAQKESFLVFFLLKIYRLASSLPLFFL